MKIFTHLGCSYLYIII